MKAKGELTDVEKAVLNIKIERLRLGRERAILVLNKGITIYFAFLIIAIISGLSGFITPIWINILVLLGLAVIVVAVLPYAAHMKVEEEEIKRLLEELEKKA